SAHHTPLLPISECRRGGGKVNRSQPSAISAQGSRSRRRRCGDLPPASGRLLDREIAEAAVELELRRRARPLEQETLQRSDAGKPQQAILIHRLDAFGGGLDVEALRQRERRRNNRRAFAA